MNDLIDFEALIDLNEILTKVEENEDINKETSQEPLSDVLDKMCESIDANSINIGLNAINSDQKLNDNIALDDTIVNLDEFNKILNETRVLNENINNLEKTILSSDEKIKQTENNAVPYHSPVADLDDVVDIVKNTAGEYNDKKEDENVSEKADNKILDLDEFDEIVNDKRVANVNTDNLENNETTLSCEAKNVVKYLTGTDFVGIANSACKIETEETNNKVNLDDTIINLDEFDEIFNDKRVPNVKIDNLENKETTLCCETKNAVITGTDYVGIANSACKTDTEETNNKINLDDTIINLDEFDEIFNDKRVPNVNIDNLENKETTLCCEAKNVVITGTDFVGIANSACKTDTEETNNKVNLDDTIINLDEFQNVLNGKCTLKKTLLSIKLAEFDVNEGMATLNYSSVPNLDKIEEQTKNDTSKIIFPVPEGKENLTTIKTFDPHNLNKDDKFDLKTNRIEEDIEVISISSTEDVIAIDDSDDDGYNSDDFEFISESEAKKQGPLTNLDVKEFTEEKPCYSDMKYHKNNFTRCIISSTEANRVTHVIPEGESYLNLFRGICAPVVMNNLYYMTNKHVLPAQSMNITDGFGFDIPEQREENPEHVAEAAESLKKIQFLYPSENRKRRRRF